MSAFSQTTVKPMCPEREMFGREKLPELPPEAYEDMFLLELSPQTTVEPVMCPEREMFGRQKLPELPPKAYDHLFLLKPDPTNGLTFQGNINVANLYFKMFLGKTYDWYHVKVKACAFDNFMKVLEKYEGEVALLPFWCWCDEGKKDGNPLYTHQRHMILCCRRDGEFMRKGWPKIPLGVQKPSKKYKCAQKKKIETPLHFIHVVGYLSQQDSGRNEDSHFCIGTSLPEISKYCLVSQVKRELLDQTVY